MIMSKNSNAGERLEQAVERLEAAVAKSAASTSERDQNVGAELATLKADNERLSAALKMVEADYAALRQVTDTVSSRLDGTIGALQSMLGR
jgi:multidrug resistance efflux pump